MTNRDLYAAVDLGSNSFHMLVARRENDELRVIDRIRDNVRLGGGLNARGQLNVETRERALDCLSRFGQRLADIPTLQIRAVGTQTFRRMANPLPFLVVAETALGCPIDVINGREEARLVWRGVTGGIGHGDRPRLVIDIGGGSTEIAAGRESEPALTESIQFGCVSVTRKAFGKGRITAKRWRRARDEIITELQAVTPRVSATGWETAIGSSGTIKAVAQILVALDRQHDDGIRYSEVRELRRQMEAFGHVDCIEFPGLSSARQPVIAGGLLVLDACMDAFEIDTLQVSTAALREGLLADLLGRLEQNDPREKTVRAMAARFQTDAEQAARVRDFALCAFEQVAETHGLARVHRDLLDWSCQLHEIGLGIAHSHYQVHSAYVVEQSDMAGFSRQEQQLMAWMLRYQRRSVPVDALTLLAGRLRPAAAVLTAILRLAVALARARNDADLPDFGLGAENDQWTLALPPGWLDSHPLSRRALRIERMAIRRLGLTLRVANLNDTARRS